jgi:hypothetical protein
MVRLAGIEPTTPWFVAKYSIQLSYSRESKEYSTGFDSYSLTPKVLSLIFQLLAYDPRSLRNAQ